MRKNSQNSTQKATGIHVAGFVRPVSGQCWQLVSRTIRPLVASSGSVMEAGVVRRFRARVSWSITASISCSSKRNDEESVTDTVKEWDFLYAQLRVGTEGRPCWPQPLSWSGSSRHGCSAAGEPGSHGSWHPGSDGRTDTRQSWNCQRDD